jgi:outer membrane protein OmpA-like peptidoglycan-associated protein
MKPVSAVLLLAALCACSHAPKPILIDDDRRPAAGPAEAERRANDALRDIEDRIKKGDLPKVRFESDQDSLTPESYETLDLIVKLMLGDEHLKVEIFAHTDNVGSEEDNLELSRRRAKAVGDYLARKGVPPPSIRYRGFGASKPIADNATEEGRAKNRRVEFYVTAREWKSVY